MNRLLLVLVFSVFSMLSMSHSFAFAPWQPFERHSLSCSTFVLTPDFRQTYYAIPEIELDKNVPISDVNLAEVLKKKDYIPYDVVSLTDTGVSKVEKDYFPAEIETAGTPVLVDSKVYTTFNMLGRIETSVLVYSVKLKIISLPKIDENGNEGKKVALEWLSGGCLSIPQYETNVYTHCEVKSSKSVSPEYDVQ